jgi:hypothetical protein
VRPAGAYEIAYERQEVGYVGGDENPIFGDCELQYVFVSETLEVLFGVESPDDVATVLQSPPNRPTREVGVKEQAGQYSTACIFRFG